MKIKKIQVRILWFSLFLIYELLLSFDFIRNKYMHILNITSMMILLSMSSNPKHGIRTGNDIYSKIYFKDPLFLGRRKDIGEEIWTMLKVSGPHLIPLGHLSEHFIL